jgi:predicted AAA+ superfamily ATPase
MNEILKPWYAVATPHEDIRKGRLEEAVFAANIWEVAQSEKGQEAFVTLEKRFQRLGADVKPVADDEIYDVVRARLFESIAPIEESDYPKKVAQAYQTMYAAHSGEVPLEASKSSYRDQIERAYPFHPLFIDALYTRWGSHPDFQRTRGVLRLLASVVGDLWQRRTAASQTQHLIQPCHIRWSIDAMQAALTRLWGPAYQSVAAADIVGENPMQVFSMKSAVEITVARRSDKVWRLRCCWALSADRHNVQGSAQKT